jgi:hypothetical protein
MAYCCTNLLLVSVTYVLSFCKYATSPTPLPNIELAAGPTPYPHGVIPNIIGTKADKPDTLKFGYLVKRGTNMKSWNKRWYAP